MSVEKVVRCPSGHEMVRLSMVPSVYLRAKLGVVCDGCGSNIMATGNHQQFYQQFYHCPFYPCPDNKDGDSANGYDLCGNCALNTHSKSSVVVPAAAAAAAVKSATFGAIRSKRFHSPANTIIPEKSVIDKPESGAAPAFSSDAGGGNGGNGEIDRVKRRRMTPIITKVIAETAAAAAACVVDDSEWGKLPWTGLSPVETYFDRLLVLMYHLLPHHDYLPPHRSALPKSVAPAADSSLPCFGRLPSFSSFSAGTEPAKHVSVPAELVLEYLTHCRLYLVDHASAMNGTEDPYGYTLLDGYARVQISPGNGRQLALGPSVQIDPAVIQSKPTDISNVTVTVTGANAVAAAVNSVAAPTGVSAGRPNLGNLIKLDEPNSLYVVLEVGDQWIVVARGRFGIHSIMDWKDRTVAQPAILTKEPALRWNYRTDAPAILTKEPALRWNYRTDAPMSNTEAQETPRDNLNGFIVRDHFKQAYWARDNFDAICAISEWNAVGAVRGWVKVSTDFDRHAAKDWCLGINLVSDPTTFLVDRFSSQITKPTNLWSFIPPKHRPQNWQDGSTTTAISIPLHHLHTALEETNRKSIKCLADESASDPTSYSSSAAAATTLP